MKTTIRLNRVLIFLFVGLSVATHVLADAYPRAVLSDNPVGYWRFEEDAGSSKAVNSASSGQSLDGGSHNVVFGATSATPALGRAAAFSGQSDSPGYIDLGNSPALMLQGDMAIEWWQYMADDPTAEDRAIIAWAGPGEASAEDVLYEVVLRYGEEQAQEKNPRPRFVTGHEYGRDVNVRIASRTPAQPNRWYHVVILRDAAARTIRYYINGMPAGEVQNYGDGHENPQGGRAAGAAIGRLGRFDRRYFHGYLDEVAVYDQLLSDERIMAHYRAALQGSDRSHSPLVVAHRGVHRFAPENTAVSYRQAIEAGAPIVELDLHRSKDGVIILMHDDTLERTTDGVGNVNDMTLQQLKTLDAGSWKDAKYAGERVPTLQEIAEICKGKTVMMLDLKDPVRGDEIAPVIGKAGIKPDRVIVAPWKVEQASGLAPYLPDTPMILLHSQLPDGYDTDSDAFFESLKGMGFSGFSLNWTHLTQTFVDDAHRHGMEVYTWTINNPEDISGAALMGVDGVITDDPAATAAHIDQVRD